MVHNLLRGKNNVWKADLMLHAEDLLEVARHCFKGSWVRTL